MIPEKLGKTMAPFVHVLAWMLLGYIFIFHTPVVNSARIPIVIWIHQALRLCLLAVIFYLNAYILVPNLLMQKRYLLFALWVLGAILVSAFFSGQSANLLRVQEAMASIGATPPPHKGLDIFTILTTLMVLGISTSMTTIRYGQRDLQLREEAERQRIISELSSLKAQINPHFFFNTLNNIYALSYSDTELSRFAIHKLSTMMRYLIYETKPDKAPLQQELVFVDDYISLMQLRLPTLVTLTSHIPEAGENLVIAPMLLLPFIENAFKHGTSSLAPSFISIDISLQKNNLQMRIANSLFPERKRTQTSSGIGLENTKRRLDLLYPGKYALQMDEDVAHSRFLVELNLSLI